MVFASSNFVSRAARAIFSSSVQTTLEEATMIADMPKTSGLEGYWMHRVVSLIAKTWTSPQVFAFCNDLLIFLEPLAKSLTVF